MIHYLHKDLITPVHPISITVIGVGGNGTQVLNDLAKINYSLLELGHIGIHVTAIDDDVIEIPNIGRQKFSPSDLKQFKAEIQISRLNRFYGFDWDCVCDKFNEQKHNGSNFIISCVDNVSTREIIKDAFYEKKNYNYHSKQYYWLDLGNGKDYGQFVLASKKIEQPKSKEKTIHTLKNIFDLFPNMKENEDISEPSCSTREALSKQDLFINPILSSFASNLIWKLLTAYKIDYHGGFINLKTMSSKPIKL